MNTPKDLAEETFPTPINSDINSTSLVEYLSRPARKNIVENLCRHFLNEQNILRTLGATQNSPGRPPSSGVTHFASMIGVSRKAVSRWLNGEMQSSNVNAERLLSIAAEIIPETLHAILLEDLERHKLEVKVYLGSKGATPIPRNGEELDL